MRTFLKTKAGVFSIALFVFIMAFVLHRVVQKRRAREAAVVQAASTTTDQKPQAPAGSGPVRDPKAGSEEQYKAALAQNAAYLDRYYQLDKQSREEHDFQGNGVTRRQTPARPADAGRVTEYTDPAASAAPVQPPPPPRISLRLQGRSAPASSNPIVQIQQKMESILQAPSSLATASAAAPAPAAAARARPKRFNPYGNVIKCELVFTIDSTNENTPFVGLVMEPVYNNGQLVIPAGAEFHGMARPDRLRDRIFSGTDWVLVFPRDRDRPNGRQLNVKGMALDRLEPGSNGMTWGITDGSYGLQGLVLKSGQDEEIKRFAAASIAAATSTLQERQTNGFGQESTRNTPRNALLHGVATTMEQIAADINAEIAKHGVFIRVAAGHQFYFYPTQIIDPDVADISSDIATVK